MTFLPGSSFAKDYLGDRWAKFVGAVWTKMEALDEATCRIPGAYHAWQYLYCQMAGMNHRVVASPQAMAMCGQSMPTQAQMDKIIDLNNQAHEAILADLDK
jgi:hypothetical protein